MLPYIAAAIVGIALHASVAQRAHVAPAAHLESADCERVRLSGGMTCYRFDGPADGELVVFVHGFSGSHRNWASTRDFLAARGYRVLTYDNYGRGHSDAAAERNTLQLFVSQLAELVLALNLNGRPFALAGISMGGPIAAGFARTYPSLVRRLVLVAPAGLRVHKPVLARIAELPLAGEVLLPLFGRPVLANHIGLAFNNPDAPHVREEIAAAKAFTERMVDDHPGFLPSLLSTMRHFPLDQGREEYAGLGTSGVPTLVVWGRNDRVVPTANSDLLKELLPHATFSFYDGCGHVPPVEAKDAFRRDLVQFVEQGRLGTETE